MTEHDDSIPPVRSGRGIPGAVRLKLKQAIKVHLAEHISRKNRHLLREHPEFSPWIGKDVGKGGETGDKRLDRLFEEVRQEVSRGKRSWPTAPTRPRGSEAETPSDLLDQVLAGGTPAIGFAELQADLRNQRALIKQAMDGCFDDNAVLVDEGLFLKLIREARAVNRDSARLAGTFNAAMRSAEVQHRVLEAAFKSHEGEPEKAEALADNLDEIFNECTGLSARGVGQ